MLLSVELESLYADLYTRSEVCGKRFWREVIFEGFTLFGGLAAYVITSCLGMRIAIAEKLDNRMWNGLGENLCKTPYAPHSVYLLPFKSLGLTVWIMVAEVVAGNCCWVCGMGTSFFAILTDISYFLR